MSEEIKTEKIKEPGIMKDYFEFSFLEKDVDGNMQGFIDVKINPKGQAFLDKKLQENPEFDEEKFFSDLVNKSLRNYIDKAEREEAGEFEEE